MYILFEKDKNKGIARIVLQLSEEAKCRREAIGVDTVAAHWDRRGQPPLERTRFGVGAKRSWLLDEPGSQGKVMACDLVPLAQCLWADSLLTLSLHFSWLLPFPII